MLYYLRERDELVVGEVYADELLEAVERLGQQRPDLVVVQRKRLEAAQVPDGPRHLGDAVAERRQVPQPGCHVAWSCS